MADSWFRAAGHFGVRRGKERDRGGSQAARPCFFRCISRADLLASALLPWRPSPLRASLRVPANRLRPRPRRRLPRSRRPCRRAPARRPLRPLQHPRRLLSPRGRIRRERRRRRESPRRRAAPALRRRPRPRGPPPARARPRRPSPAHDSPCTRLRSRRGVRSRTRTSSGSWTACSGPCPPCSTTSSSP